MAYVINIEVQIPILSFTGIAVLSMSHHLFDLSLLIFKWK